MRGECQRARGIKEHASRAFSCKYLAPRTANLAAIAQSAGIIFRSTCSQSYSEHPRNSFRETTALPSRCALRRTLRHVPNISSGYCRRCKDHAGEIKSRGNDVITYGLCASSSRGIVGGLRLSDPGIVTFDRRSAEDNRSCRIPGITTGSPTMPISFVLT